MSRSRTRRWRPNERAPGVGQGGPRGAAGRRHRVHGGDAGDDRAGRLADDGVHDAGPGAVLLRHLLPARAVRGWGWRRSGRCWQGVDAAWRRAAAARSPRWPARITADLAARGRRATGRRASGRRRRPSCTRRSRRLSRLSSTRERGGFGGAPKFPPSMVLEFLLRHHERDRRPEAALRMAEATCEAMARGGMYDQLGGGFARYSRRRRLGRPALREDAVRQRAAGAGVRCTCGGRPARRSPAGSRWRPATCCSPSCARPRAASPPRWTPTADGRPEGVFYAWTPGQLAAVLGPEDGGARRRRCSR